MATPVFFKSPTASCVTERSLATSGAKRLPHSHRQTSCAFSQSELRGQHICQRVQSRRQISNAKRRVSTAATLGQPDLKTQLKQMALAEKRWESQLQKVLRYKQAKQNKNKTLSRMVGMNLWVQITEGKVTQLSPKEAGYSVSLGTHVLLDVRPSYEHNKSWVEKSEWVPAFEQDKGFGPDTLANKATNFLMGGWWAGGVLTKRNERFMPDVVATFPKSAHIIVACQKGLRSLASCEQLYKAGYRNLYWLSGGFDAAEEGDFNRKGFRPLKLAGIGGLSEFLGWTDVQRQQARKEGLKFRLLLFVRLIGVFIAADLVLIASQQLSQYLQHVGNS